VKKSLLFLIVVWLGAFGLAGKKPFQIEDLYRLKGVSDPQVSPDGQRIAFVVTESDLPKGTSNADIYLIQADGTGLRRLTTSDKSDTHPRWSPDGKHLLFVSTRTDTPQVFILPADLGEPKAVTDLSTGVADPEWSPDGNFILFQSSVYPECGADDACNKKIDTALGEGPLQAHLADKLFYRQWTDYRDGKRQHTLLLEVSSGTVTDLTPGDFDSPSISPGLTRGYAFSPDGKEICVASKRDPDEAESTNNDLYLISLPQGEARCITAANKAFDGDPLYSPDGRYIAYRRQVTPTFEADRFRMMLFDRQTGQHRDLTPAFDYWVDDFAWSPDGRYLFFVAQVKGRYPVYRMDVARGEVTEVLPGTEARAVRGFDLFPDAARLVFCRSAVGEPTELYLAALDKGRATRLTGVNQAVVEAVDIRPAEELWVPGADGTPVHVFIVKPHGFDPAKKYPLILNIHGGPQMMWADSFRGDWQVYPGAGYVIAFPNPHGSTGYGQSYTDAISKDWDGKVIEDVMKVSDALAALPYVDAERMGAMGWSWGGYAIMWLEGHTDRFKAMAAMMGVYDLRSMHGATEELWFPEWDLGGVPWESAIYEKASPSNFASNFKTPCLVITGERDYRVPYTQSLHFFTALQKMKVPSRLVVFKNDGHWPHAVKSMPFYYNAHLDWFHKYLGGEPAPYDMVKMWRNQAFEEEAAQN